MNELRLYWDLRGYDVIDLDFKLMITDYNANARLKEHEKGWYMFLKWFNNDIKVIEIWNSNHPWNLPVKNTVFIIDNKAYEVVGKDSLFLLSKNSVIVDHMLHSYENTEDDIIYELLKRTEPKNAEMFKNTLVNQP